MIRDTHPRSIVHWVTTHVEKLGVAAVGGLVLVALCTTNWTPYQRTADELFEQVQVAREGLAAEWPAESRERFERFQTPQDVVRDTLERPMAVAEYAISQPLVRSPWARTRFSREPKYLVLRDPIADSERVLIALAPERRAADTLKIRSTENQEKNVQNVPDEFLRDRSETPADTTPVEYLPLVDENRAPAHSGRGYPYVAVRAYFDVREQIKEYARALSMPYAAAARQFEILDYQLERQWRRRDREAWSDWQTVDDLVFRDVLAAAMGRAPDVVSTRAVDPAITCPLPARITGRWLTLATHPALEGAALSEQDRRREQALFETLTRLQETKRTQSRNAVRKGGFADLLPDAGTMERDLLAAETEEALNSIPNWLRGNTAADAARSRMIDRLLKELGANLSDAELRGWLTERAAKVDRDVALFRYLDFDVTPGVTYRYRVRLVVRNPNYGRSLAAVGGAMHVSAGATRSTPWSEPTPAVSVEPLTRYFLARIDSGRDAWPEAQMNVFQYDPDVGTTIRQSVSTAAGDAIHGTASTRIADPAKREIRTESYTVRSSDVLVDALGDLRFTRAQHPELELPNRQLGFAGIDPVALIAASDGVLEMITATEQSSELALQEQRMELQDRQMEQLRLADADAVREGEALYLDYPGYGGETVRE